MELQPPDRPEYNSLNDRIESLEVVEQGAPPSPALSPPNKRSSFDIRKHKRAAFSILVIVTLISLSVAGFVFVRKLSSPETPTNNVVINTQSLDNGTLNQLSTSDDGETKQQLTISPNTLFKNDMIVQGSAQVLKDLTVGGSVTVQNAATVRDNLTVGRALTVGTNLTVNGTVTAASLNVGSINISSINISGSLVFGGHIIPGGATPSARTSNAAGGGSVTVSGNDTSGTITIKTGSGGAGELAIVTFRSAFSTVPKIQLTPINEASSSLRYFATRTSNIFTINTATATAPNTTYVFDYLVTQ